MFAILASIGLHELGHMIPAKAFGGKVTQYFIGFGPTVWSRQRGETEYGIKAIPLGGYVKIVGMLPPDKEHADKVEYDADGNRVVTVRKSNTGLFAQLVSDARAAEWETITAADEDRLFYKMAWWKKVVVMAGGPTVNLADRVLHLRRAVRDGTATPNDQTRPHHGRHGRGLRHPRRPDQRTCASRATRSALRPQAGLKPGDRFVSFNGTPVTSWDADAGPDPRQRRRSGDHRGRARRPARSPSTPTPSSTPRPTDPNDPKKLTPVGFLGVAPVVTYGHGGVVYTVQQMGGLAKQSAVALATLPVKVWGVGRGDRRASSTARPDSPVSIVGGGRLAGETASAAGFPRQGQAGQPPGLVAGFNFFIGLFNFIPLLPARRRPHRRRPLGGGPARDRPAACAGPIPATSTSPGSSRSPTSSPASCW